MNLKFVASSSGIVTMSLLFLFSVIPDILLKAQNTDLSPALTSTHIQPTANKAPVEGTLNIIAVMVEFEPDSNRFTSGNGTFGPGSLPYLEDHNINIDPLPHDKSYFEAHLEFTKNYFEEMSSGMLEIEYQVLEEVIRLDNQMEVYSPIGENITFEPLANFTRDVWEIISAKENLSIQLSPANNTAFVIFHAGVGRDIELTGTTLNRTPQDIPSVYLSRTALSRFLDDPSFTGFEIDSGNFLVNNTLILPRTLSRKGEDFTGSSFVLPLSINGLLTAQVGSHLGLPDLFNTNTGESGIGRFGLMDGAGIFAYNGLFPPRLSAWEKFYLGWSNPITVDPVYDSYVELPASALTSENSVAKINISNEEYFLIENRHRNPDGNGVTLTIQSPDGQITQQTFTNLDQEFVEQQSGFDGLLSPGVIKNVSNYDFALPGGFDEDNERDLDGGILIWHIDEGVINQKIGIEGINNNPYRRGVNLKEADGAQDIGRPVQIGISQNEPNGSAFDFWWSGNNATVITQTDSLVLYVNRFGPDTTPSNNSNTGAVSYFELFDFSDNQPIANFSVRPVSPFADTIELTDSNQQVSVNTSFRANNQYWSRYPLSLSPILFNSEQYVLIPGSNGFQLYSPSEKKLLNSVLSRNHIQQPFIDQESSFFTSAPNPLSAGDEFILEIISWNGVKFSVDQQFNTDFNTGFISSFEDGILDIDGTRDRIKLDDSEFLRTDISLKYSDLINGFQSIIDEQNLLINYPGGQTSINFQGADGFTRSHSGLISVNRQEFYFYLLLDGKLSVFDEENNFETETVIFESEFIEWPAIVDFNSDGNPDFLFTDRTSNQLIAKNIRGGTLNNFPINPPENSQFLGTPLIADFNGDGSSDIVIPVQDLYSLKLLGYNQHGDLLEGFPLLIGGVTNQSDMPLHPVLIEDKLVAVSHSGELKMWEFKNIQNVLYPSRYGNFTNNKVTGIIELETEPEFDFKLLNKNETYNWPNPATDETNLRFQTRGQADIEIKITTMSGRLIYDNTLKSRGGPAEEITIDTSGWSSGGYFALITANDGQYRERKLVKIAITK